MATLGECVTANRDMQLRGKIKALTLHFLRYAGLMILCSILCACKSVDEKKSEFISRGNQLARQGRYDESISDFSEALKMDSCFALSFFNRALSFERLGEVEAAKEDYSSAIRCDPQMLDAYFNRGLIYLRASDYEKALQDFWQAYRADSTYSEAGAVVALTVFKIGLVDSAISVLSDVIDRDSSNPAYFNNRGEFYRVKGDTERALTDLNRAIELDSAFFEVYHSLASLYADIGDTTLEKLNLSLFLRYADSSETPRIDSIRRRLSE